MKTQILSLAMVALLVSCGQKKEEKTISQNAPQIEQENEDLGELLLSVPSIDEQEMITMKLVQPQMQKKA